MSPSGTMARVYAELRRRIMDGGLRPGVRLDPARLCKEMAASMTPIRDALHQLTGEGLVESWKHEGFWIADLNETVIRDRYDWCRDLVHLCLQGAPDRAPSAIGSSGSDYADIVTHVLRRIAALSANQEHWRSMISLCDRTYILRRTEALVLEDPLHDVEPLLASLDERAWAKALDLYEAFHLRRMSIIAQLATALRTR
jgi:DNA-binding GntR family transcriptional regulator